MWAFREVDIKERKRKTNGLRISNGPYCFSLFVCAVHICVRSNGTNEFCICIICKTRISFHLYHFYFGGLHALWLSFCKLHNVWLSVSVCVCVVNIMNIIKTNTSPHYLGLPENHFYSNSHMLYVCYGVIRIWIYPSRIFKKFLWETANERICVELLFAESLELIHANRSFLSPWSTNFSKNPPNRIIKLNQCRRFQIHTQQHCHLRSRYSTCSTRIYNTNVAAIWKP